MKIEIRTKTDFEGVTYYYLYVNDAFIKLSRELEVIQKARDIAVDVYKSGKYVETVVETIIL